MHDIKGEGDLAKDIVYLKAKIDRLNIGMARIEKLEKSLSYHEMVLTKKVSDMHGFEEKLDKHVDKDVFNELKKEMKRLDKHDDLIFESARYIRELVNEINKLKESQRILKEQALAKKAVARDELDEQIFQIRSALKEHLGKQSPKPAARQDLLVLRQELHDRMSQLEYQNKILLKYLKKVDDILVKEGIIKLK